MILPSQAVCRSQPSALQAERHPECVARRSVSARQWADGLPELPVLAPWNGSIVVMARVADESARQPVPDGHATGGGAEGKHLGVVAEIATLDM